jgi:hypothetical protein
MDEYRACIDHSAHAAEFQAALNDVERILKGSCRAGQLEIGVLPIAQRDADWHTEPALPAHDARAMRRLKRSPNPTVADMHQPGCRGART